MTWLRCKICGYESKHPDGRGLHKHVRDVHGLSAWDYYHLFIDALQDRIEAKVVKVVRVKGLGRCWEFQGRPTKAGRWGNNRRGEGYRDMRIADAPTTKVHKLAVFAWSGYMPPSTEQVLHLCDNPACCNPEHLTVGTNAENVLDRVRKGRSCRGVAHPKARLSREQVIQVRQQSAWASNREIADSLGVEIEVVRRCALGITYRDVVEEEIPF